ncbi:MAG: citrate lyase acyl carrier protein [Synergistaceae bacterium]|jgi:citrate lyase subunit gamma (acyl carrier protein)|nr:citrate lyase acyl carrier protein [Synergistaceae bacterium]
MVGMGTGALEPGRERASMAGTVESMDCLVTVTGSSGGRRIEIAGASAVRFKRAMELKINAVLDELGAPDVAVSVQDNGALDLVLGARVEAALRRFVGGDLR